MKSLNINAIRIDGGTQQRAHISDETVADYRHAISEGVEMPHPIVFFDGAEYWLADGFHRVHAHREAGKASIKVEVRTGTQRDAVLFSVGANGEHGLRRSNDDKRKAVMTLLGDPEWSKWSDREIARQCAVTHPFVAGLRAPKVVTVTTKPADQVVTVTTPNAVKTAAASSKEPANPIPAAAPAGDDGMESQDEILAGLEQENKALSEQMASLAQDDTKAELRKQVTVRQGVESRLAQEMERSNRLDKELRRLGKHMSDLRVIFGVESNSQVVTAARELMKKAA